MTVNWLIEEETFAENLQPLLDEIKQQEMEYKLTRYIPFENDHQFSSLFNENDCVVVYSSLQMGRFVQKHNKWVPGVYCNLQKYECTHYYPVFGELLLNSNYVMLPFGELLRRKEFLFNTLGNSDSLFVRPSSGFKTFTGKVAHKENWEKEVEYFGFYDIDPSQVVVVAEPHNLINEWRFVVVEGKVVSGSQYRNAFGIKLCADIPDRIRDFAQKAVTKADYQPDLAWCIDICEDTDNRLFVLEIGCFSCAGLYVAPMEPIVREISRIALTEWNELQSTD